MRETEDAARVRFFPPGIPLLAIFAGSLADRLLPFDVAFVPDAPVRFVIGGAIFLTALLGLGVWPIMLFRTYQFTAPHGVRGTRSGSGGRVIEPRLVQRKRRSDRPEALMLGAV